MDLPQDALMQWIFSAVAALGIIFVWFKRARGPLAVQSEALGEDMSQRPTQRLDNGQVRVTKILVHPIKSCRGTSVSEVRYTPQGLETPPGMQHKLDWYFIGRRWLPGTMLTYWQNDRKWAVLDPTINHILTAREVPKLILIEPKLQYDSLSPTNGKLVVTVRPESGPISFSVPIEPTPDMLSQWKVVDNPELFGESTRDAYIIEALSPSDPSPSKILSDFLDRPVHLVVKGPTPRFCPPTLAFPNLTATAVFQDGFPILVASEESLEAVSQAVNDAAKIGPDAPGKIGGINHARWQKEKLPIERFRPNIVVRGASVPFAEDIWQKIYITPTGSKAKDESRAFTLVSRCARCLLPNVDPATGVRDAAVPYKVITKFRTGVDPARAKIPCFEEWVQPGH